MGNRELLISNLLLLRYCEYHLIVRDGDQWQGFLIARSINTLESFRSYPWGLEAGFYQFGAQER